MEIATAEAIGRDNAGTAPGRKRPNRKPGNKPVKVKIKGVFYWRVRLGVRFGKSKPQAKCFQTEAEAKTYLAQQLIMRTNSGIAAFSLSDRERVEAASALARVKTVGASLTEAVDYFLKHAKPPGGTRLLSEAIPAFVSSRASKGCDTQYLANLRSQLAKFEAAFGTCAVGDLKSPQLQDWINQRGAPKTKNNYVITLRALFAFCQKQGWSAENPATSVDKSKVLDTAVEIFNLAEAQKIMTAAAQFRKGEFLPAVAIGLFAGLRRSEVCTLTWDYVKESAIEVTAKTSKTGKRRLVEIQPNLKSWLAPFRKASGPVFKGTEDLYEDRRQALKALAEVPWPQNALRHSAASYHLAHFQDEAKTALQMGHSIEILRTHYRQLVPRECAAEFWLIRPTE